MCELRGRDAGRAVKRPTEKRAAEKNEADTEAVPGAARPSASRSQRSGSLRTNRAVFEDAGGKRSRFSGESVVPRVGARHEGQDPGRQ